MDDFRVGPTSSDNPYRDAGRSNAKNRKKDRQAELSATEQEDVVSLSGEDEAGEETGDYYSPSAPAEETE